MISENISPVIEAIGIRKQFPGVLALDEVGFDLRQGEVHALLGANGAGKSTLIKILAGFYQPDGGRIVIEGHPVRIADTQRSRELGIRVIYQELAVIPHLSVAENIFLGAEKVGTMRLIDWTATFEAAQGLLDRVGANFSSRTRVRDLSTGQRQLVEIAKAFNTRARVVILDEPTAALSHGEAERLFDLVRALAAEGVGIIYVSHRLEEIAGLVERVTVLRDGVSMGTFRASELDRKRIVQLITGHEEVSVGRSQRSGRTAGDILLEVNNVSRSGEFENVSLNVRRGEIVVITGLLGAGRTELLEALFGARRYDTGEIRFDGKPVSFGSPSAAIEAGFALVPEDRHGQGILEGMPVYMNMTLASLRNFVGIFGLKIKNEIKEANRLIRDLSIRTPSCWSRARYLSGGNQQKVVLGKWLLTSAEVMLFDEPTQGLDVGAKDEIYRLMDRFAEEGKAVLVVSSDLEEVLTIADRVYAMRNGRIVGEFAGSEAKASGIMSAMTLGEMA